VLRESHRLFYIIFMDFAVKLIRTVLSGVQMFQEYLLSMPICIVFEKLASRGAL
jgi:hypothetical protein